MSGKKKLEGLTSMNKVMTRFELVILIESYKFDTGNDDLNGLLEYLNCVRKIICNGNYVQESHQKTITAVDWVANLLHRMTELQYIHVQWEMPVTRLMIISRAKSVPDGLIPF